MEATATNVSAELAAELDRAWTLRAAVFPATIGIARPSHTVAVSLTGPTCAMDCAHCGGHYLHQMITLDEAMAAATPRVREARSFLISGGCQPGLGTVPFMDHLPELRELRRRGRLNFHVGLVGEHEAVALRDLADSVSFDLVGDDATINEVLGLNRRVEDYVTTLDVLQRHTAVIPHVLVGMHGGRLRGERRALELLAGRNPRALVFIVFVPTPGTRLAAASPPEALEVARLMAGARALLPRTPIGLGCMRPGGAYRSRLDPLAVWAGVQWIVQPAPAALAEAAARGLTPEYGEECCVLCV
ncbi:MAG: radical SAM protein [Bacillota bacterium]|nr:radical SAM protein [Bacillota bacterium]